MANGRSGGIRLGSIKHSTQNKCVWMYTGQFIMYIHQVFCLAEPKALGKCSIFISPSRNKAEGRSISGRGWGAALLVPFLPRSWVRLTARATKIDKTTDLGCGRSITTSTRFVVVPNRKPWGRCRKVSKYDENGWGWGCDSLFSQPFGHFMQDAHIFHIGY